jgi:hypothetical protein
MKKILLLFVCISTLLATPTPSKAWDQKDTGLLVATVSFLVGGELIRHAYNNRKGVWEFVKNKPHYILAGVSMGLIGIRAYKGIVFDPLMNYMQPNLAA